jgi:hypothetical protein
MSEFASYNPRTHERDVVRPALATSLKGEYVVVDNREWNPKYFPYPVFHAATGKSLPLDGQPKTQKGAKKLAQSVEDSMLFDPDTGETIGPVSVARPIMARLIAEANA